MVSATLASSGARATFGKDGSGQRRRVSHAAEKSGLDGDSRGGLAEASTTHPPGAGATLTIPLIVLFLAASSWGVTRLIGREPRAVPGRHEWPPIEPPDHDRERPH